MTNSTGVLHFSSLGKPLVLVTFRYGVIEATGPNLHSHEVIMLASSSAPKFLLQARIKDFAIPPITDALVIGKEASIGTNALKKALNLLIPEDFEQVTMSDEIVADVLIKSILLRRLTKDRLVTFVIEQIKPFMSAADILHVQLDMEILLTGELE